MTRTSIRSCAAAFLIASAILAPVAAHADEAACKAVRAAGSKTRSLTEKTTGYNFVADTPDIYGPGDETCALVRDEAVNGQPATLYTQDYKAPKGSTHAQIWVSKASGQILREELDGDVKGKGKGHISMTAK